MFENERKHLFDVVKFDEPGFDERVLSPNHSRFTVKPLLRGYGNTIGNAMRSILLSAMPGSAIISIQGEALSESAQLINGVKEEVYELIQNFKSVCCVLHRDEPLTVNLTTVGPSELTAGDLQTDSDLVISNPELHLLTLAEGARLELSVVFANGIGYSSAKTNQEKFGDHEHTVYLDSVFSPVVKAEYTVEPARVGGNIDNDRLDMDVYTDGTMSPGEAVSFAAKFIIGSLSLFTEDIEQESSENEMFRKGTMDTQEKELGRSVEELDFSVRSFNCLKRAGINTVRQLTEMTESEMLRIRNLGKKSFDEICEKLASIGLHFKEE